MMKKGQWGWLLAALALNGCQNETPPENTAAAEPVSVQWQAWNALPDPRSLWFFGDQWVAINGEGNLVQGDRVLQQGDFDQLEGRRLADGSALLVSVDQTDNQLVLFALQDNQLTELQRTPAPPYQINGMCLYQDRQALLSAFVLDERGGADQWLLDAQRAPQPIRHLVIPPDVEACAVDDASASLYISEETVGLWRYNADAEQDPQRTLVDLIAPRGALQKSASGVATIPGGVLVLDKEAAVLHRYTENGTAQPLPVPDLLEPERLAVRVHEDDDSDRVAQASVYVLDDAGAGVRAVTLEVSLPEAQPDAIPVVLPSGQTDSVARYGDAADDPAIWINRADPARSRILGTDKKAGLYVYDLQGKQRGFLPVGRVNNVDVRYGITLNGARADIAVASNRDHNSLHWFLIDPESGQVTEGGEIATGLEEIYGLCLYRDDVGLYAFANGKSGMIEQWLLSDDENANAVTGSLVRRLQVNTQPEGCVADETQQRLFVGEEDVAIWAFAAGADQPVTAERVLDVSERVHADIEGLSLYQNDEDNLLVISSQGNNSYVVVDAQPPYAYRGRFRIGMNVAAGIDGASETDGLAVTSANLGGDYQAGMLVVQDGRNRLPQAPQNFKMVPWSAIAVSLSAEREE